MPEALQIQNTVARFIALLERLAAIDPAVIGDATAMRAAMYEPAPEDAKGSK